PVGHIMDRLAEHQLATRFWNTVFLASSAVLITVFIDHFVNNVWLAAAGGIAVMAVLTLVISARSPRRIGAKHYEISARLTAWLVRPLAALLGPLPGLFIAEPDNEQDDENDDDDLEERHFRAYVFRAYVSPNRTNIKTMNMTTSISKNDTFAHTSPGHLLPTFSRITKPT